MNSLKKCGECGRRTAHTPSCSYGPPREERERFIRDNAVALVNELEAKIDRQAEALRLQGGVIRDLSRSAGPFFDVTGSNGSRTFSLTGGVEVSGLVFLWGKAESRQYLQMPQEPRSPPEEG